LIQLQIKMGMTELESGLAFQKDNGDTPTTILGDTDGDTESSIIESTNEIENGSLIILCLFHCNSTMIFFQYCARSHF